MLNKDDGAWVRIEARRIAERDGRRWDDLTDSEIGSYIDRGYRNFLARKNEERAATQPTQTRHPSTEHLLSLFEYEHLPLHLQEISKPLHDLAHSMADMLGEGPELSVGLRRLWDAKNNLVMQRVVDLRDGEATDQ